MKSMITISGDISSVCTISNALFRGKEIGYEENSYGNRITYYYRTKKDAIAALHYAWDALKEYANSLDYCNHDILSYDAGRAEIHRYQE